MKPSQPDYYAILGVERNASPEDIKRRYRELARQFHPDRHNDNPLAGLAAERFKQIVEAWEVLGDPIRRAEYDAGGVAGGAPEGAAFETTLARISELCDQRLWSQAMAMCEGATADFGHAWEIYFWEAVIHLNMGQYPRSAQLFQWCIDRGAQEGMVHNCLGVALLNLQRPAEAVASFRQAVSRDGELPLYVANLAIACEHCGDRAAADRHWARLEQIDPQNESLALRHQAHQQTTVNQVASMAGVCALLECIFDCL